MIQKELPVADLGIMFSVIHNEDGDDTVLDSSYS
jgi:hypothetical protein